MVAGKGSRLHPLTLKHPKSMYKLDEDMTLLQRMVMLIKKASPPIVGVPAFFSCHCGPSEYIGCLAWRRRKGINARSKRMVKTKVNAKARRYIGKFLSCILGFLLGG